MSNEECIFYQDTRDGKRCIFLPPEEWRLSKSKYLKYCTSGGKGCPILSNYYSIMKIEKRK